MPSRRVVPAVLLAFASLAQNPPAFRVDANLVTVPCVATNSHGATVTDLQREEFRVFDNGAPQRILNLWRDTDLPLTVGVIVDVSVSQRAFVQEHDATVTGFLERVIRPLDRAFVVRVSDRVILASEFIGTSNGLRQVILPTIGGRLGEPCPNLRDRSLCGGTQLWDAVFSSARFKLRERNGSKALIILSDGNDTGSLHDLNTALQEVQRAETVAYAIRYPDSEQSGAVSENLLRLSNDTGGLQFDPPRGKLDAVLARVQADLRTRYVLGFVPDSPDKAKTHQLRVEVTRPGLNVRFRREYVTSR